MLAAREARTARVKAAAEKLKHEIKEREAAAAERLAKLHAPKAVRSTELKKKLAAKQEVALFASSALKQRETDVAKRAATLQAARVRKAAAMAGGEMQGKAAREKLVREREEKEAASLAAALKAKEEAAAVRAAEAQAAKIEKATKAAGGELQGKANLVIKKEAAEAAALGAALKQRQDAAEARLSELQANKMAKAVQMAGGAYQGKAARESLMEERSQLEGQWQAGLLCLKQRRAEERAAIARRSRVERGKALVTDAIERSRALDAERLATASQLAEVQQALAEQRRNTAIKERVAKASALAGGEMQGKAARMRHACERDAAALGALAAKLLATQRAVAARRAARAARVAAAGVSHCRPKPHNAGVVTGRWYSPSRDSDLATLVYKLALPTPPWSHDWRLARRPATAAVGAPSSHKQHPGLA